MTKRIDPAVAGLLILLACSPSPSLSPRADEQISTRYRLPTGAYLDPAGKSFDLGSMPLSMIASPDSASLIVLLNGWRDQGIQVVERETGRVTQTLSLPAVFLGLAFARDGKTLYVSGGNGDVIYELGWQDARATLQDSIVLEARPKGRSGKRYPSGLAVSPDGKMLYAAENLSDSLDVIDLESKRVVQRLPTGRYPYGIVASADGTLYVSAWGGSSVAVFNSADGKLTQAGEIAAPRHPSALLLSADVSRLFVASASTDQIAAIDLKTRGTIARISDRVPRGPSEGSTPNAFAISRDGSRLFVAEADNNAVAVVNLSARTAGRATPYSADSLAGRIPTGWYPTAISEISGTLYVLNAKGRGTAPNPTLEQPNRTRTPRTAQYTLGQISGTLTVLPSPTDVSGYSARVAQANGWNGSHRRLGYPPFKHVIYIIKENRTYDQMFGDLREADGDTSLSFFPRPVSPNHHALAERFGIFDRFFVNAEVSPDGHNWSTGAYAGDYAQKTIPSNYSARGRSYDYEGRNRGRLVTDDVSEGGSGYLWTLAEAAGISYRNYGEFVDDGDFDPNGTSAPSYTATKANLDRHTNHDYPGFGLSVSDQRRADVWLAEFKSMVTSGEMPALEIIRLPNDHTGAARAGMHTPRAYVADNDLALGRMMDALSHSPYWKNTVVFVLEDDAQAGPDHVDSHRAPMLVISAYNRGGVFHRFVNTTDVLATIEEILGLGRMSQFDYYGRPLREIWNSKPNLAPYVSLTPAVPLTEMNPSQGALATASKQLALSKEDQSDDETFNRILWKTMKGKQRYPGPTRMSTLELTRAR